MLQVEEAFCRSSSETLQYFAVCLICALEVPENLMLQVELEEGRHAEAEKHSAAESTLQTRLGDAQSVITQLQSTTTRLQVTPVRPAGIFIQVCPHCGPWTTVCRGFSHIHSIRHLLQAASFSQVHSAALAG